MNQAQRKYAQTRLIEILNKKHKALDLEFTTKGKQLTSVSKLTAIRQGTVKLKKDADVYDTLRNAFDFSKLETDDIINKKALTNAREKLCVRFNKIEGEIMLGDGEKALKLLEIFAAN